MSQNNRHIDELFREELGSYTELPAAAVWASLENRLDLHHKTDVPGKKFISYRWLWYAVLAVLTAVVVFLTVRSFSTKHNGAAMISAPADHGSTAYADNSMSVQTDGGAKAANTDENVKAVEVTTTDKPSLAKESINKSDKKDEGITATKNKDDKKQTEQQTTNGKDKNAKQLTKQIKPAKTTVQAQKASSSTAPIAPTSIQASTLTDESKSGKLAKQSGGEVSKKNAIHANAQERNTDNKTVEQTTNPVTTKHKSKHTKQQVLESADDNKAQQKSLAADTKSEQADKPAHHVVIAKNDKRKSMAKPHIADTTANDDYKTGGNITSRNAADIKNTYAAATGNRNSSSNAHKNQKPSAKKTKNAAKTNQTESDNLLPKWDVKPAANAKTKTPTDAKPNNKPEVKWQSGFVPEDKREAHSAKVSDITTNKGDKGGGSDNASPEEDKNSGGGGGGATAGYDDKEKKKKNKDGKKFMFEFGVKLGYEVGFGSYNANKGVLMPYLQYNIARTIGLVIQPSLKYASINKLDIGDPQSFYQITSSILDSSHVKIPGDSLTPAKIIRSYSYIQLHDSIVIKHAITQKTYFEFELPVMLQYKLAKNFGVYFGVSVNYSKIAQIEEQKKTYTGITRQDKLSYPAVPDTAMAPIIPSVDSKFSYDYEPYSKYNPTAISNATTNPFRFNYMVGFNYLIANRILLDVMYTKSLSNQTYIPDTRVREIYKQGYLRVSLGYKLSK